MSCVFDRKKAPQQKSGPILKQAASFGANEFRLKIIFLGEIAVGKTSIIRRFVHEDFLDDPEDTTIFLDQTAKVLKIKEKVVRLKIFDTAGSERFRTLSSQFFRGTHGVFLVYDIADRESFTKLTNWLTDARNNTTEDVEIVLVGNKLDLVESRAVSLEEVTLFAEKAKITYLETSAKTGQNVSEAFKILVEKIISKRV